MDFKSKVPEAIDRREKPTIEQGLLMAFENIEAGENLLTAALKWELREYTKGYEPSPWLVRSEDYKIDKEVGGFVIRVMNDSVAINRGADGKRLEYSVVMVKDLIQSVGEAIKRGFESYKVYISENASLVLINSLGVRVKEVGGDTITVTVKSKFSYEAVDGEE